MQYLTTHDDALSADAVAADYANVSAFIDYWGASLPSLGGFSPDYDGPPPPGSGGSWGSGDYVAPEYISADYAALANCGEFRLLISNSPPDVFVGISNTLPGITYTLLTNSDLTTTNWNVAEVLTASGPVVWSSPFTVTGTTNLFFMARSVWPALLWVTNLTCSGDVWGWGIASSPALSLDENHVYVTTTGNLLYSLDTSSGVVELTTGLTIGDGEMTPSPAVDTSGDIVVGSTDGFLISFAANLTVNWSNNLAIHSSGSAVYATPAVTAGGTIYIGTDDDAGGDSDFFSTNTSSHQNWLFSPAGNNPGHVDGLAAVASDCTVYFLGEDSRLYALYPDGNVKWFLPVPGHTEPDSSPAIGPDGTILVGSDSPYLYAVNPDGSLNWAYHIPNTNDSEEAIYSSPVIDSIGTVYVGGAESIEKFANEGIFFPSYTDFPRGVYAITNGQLKWAFTNVPGWIVGSVAVAEDGTVYAGAASTNHAFGILYAITNGVQKWAFQSSNDIVSSPVICADGGVIFTDEASNVYKVAGCSPLASSPAWPMFHHDPQHTGSLAGTNCPEAGCEAPFPNNGAFEEGQNRFVFAIAGPKGSTWAVYASTNLLTLTNTGSTVTLDSDGQGLFLDANDLGGVSNVFYCLSNGCCSKVIGFVVFSAAPGTNMIADPFYQVDDSALQDIEDQPNGVASPMNTVGALFCGFPDGPDLPEFGEGTNLYGWTGTGFATNTAVGNGSGVWSPNGDIPLVPGVSAILSLPTNSPGGMTLWFIGLVRDAVTNQIVPGTNFLGSALPTAGRISTELHYTNATAGDLLQTFNTNHVFTTYTNNGGTNWSPYEPYIGLAQGFILFSATNHTWIQRFSPCGAD